MKQATVKLPSGEYCFCETLTFIGKPYVSGFIKYPPGSWQLLGADPTNLTEQEAGEIVEGYGLDKWRNYKVESQYEEWLHKLPTTSLDSLAESLGISKPYVVLKNIEK